LTSNVVDDLAEHHVTMACPWAGSGA